MTRFTKTYTTIVELVRQARYNFVHVCVQREKPQQSTLSQESKREKKIWQVISAMLAAPIHERERPRSFRRRAIHQRPIPTKTLPQAPRQARIRQNNRASRHPTELIACN